MTCTRFETPLALYVERDLPAADVPAVEAHLGSCAGCRAFLDGLRASQAMVRDLGAEPIEAVALAGLLDRVAAAAIASPLPTRGRGAWALGWAAAAALVVSGVVWLATASRVAPRGRGVAMASAAPIAPVPAPRVPPLVATRSTPRALARVSPHVGQAGVARRHTDRPAGADALSSEDADQLARAVVAIARVQRVPTAADEAAPAADAEPTPLVQIATADPNVVIFWRLDTNGGK